MRVVVKRDYRFQPLPSITDARGFLNLAKEWYLRRFPSQETSSDNPFSYCLVYLVINPDKTVRLDFAFPQDFTLVMKFIHKRPRGAKIGEEVRNVDIREITNYHIPPYGGKYYFDFVLFVLDITTQGYWGTNLLTHTVCADLRYYLSRERRQQYRTIGLRIAQSYTRTYCLGHVNLKRGKLKSSTGITKLIRHGWIPTISLLPQPYGEMVRIIESTNDMNQVDEFAVRVFNANFRPDVVSRWLEASLVQKRKDILSRAMEAYSKGDYHSTVYILLPQIEGLITEHIKRKRQSAQQNLKDRFKQFGDIIKGEPFNTEMTRYLTDLLVSNLTKSFYKMWYPYPKRGKRYRPSSLSPQRNVVLHGEVNTRYFTPENCLKLISILDAIILLSLRKREIPGVSGVK
jgi:hypothetical protein